MTGTPTKHRIWVNRNYSKEPNHNSEIEKCNIHNEKFTRGLSNGFELAEKE
jgi:hypothetical protein